MTKITLIAGARPNFMKIAPIIQAIDKANTYGRKIEYRLVHTGQHYDQKMSHTFFEELGIPEPHAYLGAGGGTQAEQTAAIMLAFEKDLLAHSSDLVLVVGDVNSTMACAITAKKLNTRVAHVEAGIRSFDLTMPEEINRMVTDSISDLFFTTSDFANQNLRRSGVADNQIHFVGNVMIDTLLANEQRFRQPDFWTKLDLKHGDYIIMTLHRPANVDDVSNLESILTAISESAGDTQIIFPVHPRTRKTLEGVRPELLTRLFLIEPLGYLEFNYLVKHAAAVITDSGGITEETTVMGVPCITLRQNTERPETCEQGTNELVGTDPENIKAALRKLLSGQWKKGSIPPLWDGKAAERIVQVLMDLDRKL